MLLDWFQNWISFLGTNWSTIMELTVEHIQIVGTALIIAIVIGVPLAIYLTTNEYLANTILQAASVIMTIPSIALFGIMIPIFSLINQGIGFIPAVVALILYSQLPIVRNTYTAIKNVDPNIRDAAIGIGMKTWQRLFRVEIPNAIPVIMAGIRTAVVLNIGIGAVAAFIGAGGLGVMIYQGITRGDQYMIISASIAVSLLAIVADFVLYFIQKILSPRGLTDNPGLR